MNKVKRFMLKVVEDHVDPMTGEVCCTTLAEDAIDVLGVEGADVWDLAVDVAEKYEWRDMPLEYRGRI